MPNTTDDCKKRNLKAYKLNCLVVSLYENEVFDINPHKGSGYRNMLKKLAPTRISDIKTKYTSAWKQCNYDISKTYDSFLEEVQQTLYLPNDFWVRTDITKDHIERYVETYRNIVDTNAKLTSLLQTIVGNIFNKDSLTKQEEDLVSKAEEALQTNTFQEYFTDLYTEMDSLSDAFLETLFDLLYKNGQYEIIDTFLLDKMNNTSTEFQALKAHTFGQVGRYQQAAGILNNIIQNENNPKVILDLQTAMVSNGLRQWYAGFMQRDNKRIDNEDCNILNIFLEAYRSIFLDHEHYYPGVNYAYMIAIVKRVCPSIDTINTIKTVHTVCEDSIGENSYWAKISDIEFDALQDTFDQSKFDSMIQQYHLTVDALSRTLRQIVFFDMILERCDNPLEDNHAIHTLEAAIRTELNRMKQSS